MKKTFTFYDLIDKKRLFCLLFLLLLCNMSFSQTFCRPTSHTTNGGGGLLCLGLNVDSPTRAYDQDVNSYATIAMGVSVGCFAEETLSFDQTAKAGDQIVLYLGDGNPLLSAGVLSNSTVQAFLSGEEAGSAVALNGLINIQLLAGTNIQILKFTLTKDANQVKIRTSGTLSVLNSLRIYDVRLQFAKPTIAGGETQSVCIGQSLALTATAATGTSVAWYGSPTATTPLSSVGTYITPALTATTTYYVSTSRNGGCESDERLPVTINVINPVKPTISATGTTICSVGATQATSLSVINPVLGTTYNWYSDPTAGILLSTGSTYAPTVPTGISNFYVEASIGSCKSARTQVTVTSTRVPGLATILTQSVSIISGQNATLNASTAEAGVSLDWYDVPTGGTKLLGNSNTFTTPILTATTSTVIKTYYVETSSTLGGCVSATRVPVTVTVLPNALGGCLEANSQQTTQDGLCLLCSSITPNNSVDGNSATSARLTLPAGLLGGSIQQVLQFNNPGKAGDIVDVELALPGGIADVSLLGGVSLATYNGTTYNGDRVFINNSLVSLQLLSGNRFKASIVAHANFDRIEIRFGAVVTLLTSLDIYQATYRYKAPTVSGTTTICGSQGVTLNANPALGETIKWYDAVTAGNLLSSLPVYTTPILSANTTYYVEVTRNGCVNSERNPIPVTVTNPFAPTTVVASPVNICTGDGTTITVQSPVVDTTYKWYDVATGGTSLFTGTSFTTPSLTATKDYYVEGVIGSCSSTTRTKVTVNVNPRPSVPVPLSSNVVIQSGQSVTLGVTANSGFGYNWYDAPTGGNLLLSNSDTYTPSPVLTTNKTFYVEARVLSSDCTSSTRAIINVSIAAPPVITGCLQANNQTTSSNGLCIGCGALPGTEGFSVDGNDTTAAVLQNTVGVINAYTQQRLDFANPGFAGDIIEVDLEVSAPILNISALSYISLSSYGVSGDNPDGGSISTLLNIQLLGGNRFKASFIAGANFTGVQVRFGGAVSAISALNIYGASYSYKKATINMSIAPICSGQPVSLTASSTATGETYKWFTAATGGTAISTSATYNIPSIISTTTYYLEATRLALPIDCLNSTRQPVVVNVNPEGLPSDIIIASPALASCAGTAVLSPTSNLSGAKFKYYKDQTQTTPIADGEIGSFGEVYAINASTSELTITGLTATGTPYN